MEDSRNLTYSDELAADLVHRDFVLRGANQGRREFLMDYCKEENLRDFKT